MLKKTWQWERLVHVALLVLAGLGQLWHQGLFSGDWVPVKSILAMLFMVVGFSAFQGVTSAEARRKEKMTFHGIQPVFVDCERSIGWNLRLGRAAFFLVGLVLAGWVSIASIIWDEIIYPTWRREYRKRKPYTGEGSLPELPGYIREQGLVNMSLDELLVKVQEAGAAKGWALKELLWSQKMVQYPDARPENPAVAPGWGAIWIEPGGRVDGIYSPRNTLREVLLFEHWRLTR